MNEIHELQDVGIDQARARLAELINLPEPAPLAVTRRALADQKFAMYLMLTKDSPELQKQLFDDPRNRGYEGDGNDPGSKSGANAAGEARRIAGQHSTGELLTNVSTAFVKWSGTGFKQVDDETRARRWAACQACEYLADPPESILYQGLKLLVGKDTKVCSACGCAANKKVGIPTERCPVEREEGSGVSMWGEPWVGPKAK
ncbi:hypothetical protein KY49_6883 [Burkholderia sp. MSHR3999]|uniref:hypothetical protein n=1 Tax=Burkholderia sp. MSHR3999 TaxID=1542965 RepID=UPI0005AC4481|nr:hypothetical protein [Burkholderia sp. MSHR3999]KIP17081.1 hypothetical protein KY49_6883 [Burkholderia sp. MSHR3999]